MIRKPSLKGPATKRISVWLPDDLLRKVDAAAARAGMSRAAFIRRMIVSPDAPEGDRQTVAKGREQLH
jgi:metal-responsive CopG/Arc/MetJ family transcriptional regulator